MADHPLFVIGILFSLSLFASVVLFKYFKNSAMIKTPAGQFGGAIAGFIGVFLLLQNAFTELTTVADKVEIDLPAKYKSFISKDYGFAFGYPAGLPFLEIGTVKLFGSIIIDPTTESNMVFGVGSIQGLDFANMTPNDAWETAAQAAIAGMTEVGGATVERIENHAIQGKKSKLVELKQTQGGRETPAISVIIPNLENKYNYIFVLSTNDSTYNRDRETFLSIVSTLKQF
jgi:hypothetical protein